MADARQTANSAALPPPWPTLPAEIAERHCQACSWAWNGERMRIKYVNRSCPVHGHLGRGETW